MELVRQKNVATYITFPLVDADGDVVSGATGLDSEIDTWSDGSNPDGFADCTNEATEIGSTGVYYLSLSQSEMNADYIYILVKSNAKTQHILIRTTVGDPLNFATTDDGGAINVASGVVDANVEQILDDAQSATDLKDFADAGYDPGTNKVQGVVLTDTTTDVTNEVSADTVKISGDSTAADNLELDYDGTGYTKVNSTIGTTTTNTDMAGTNNAALASVCTEPRLAELDAANLPTDIAAIPTTPMRGTDGANTTVPDAAGTLAAYDPPTKAEMDAAHALLATESKVDDILLDTGTTLPAQIAALNDPTAAAIATAVMAKVVDGSIDVTEALAAILAVLAGDVTKLSNTYTYEDQSAATKVTKVVSDSAVEVTIA